MISPQSVEPSQPVSYAFFYDSNRRNLKEFLKNTSCSWCGLRCKSLHSLLYHLLCSHDRFNFFLKLSGSPQVEVYPSPTLKLTEFTTRDDFASNMESFSYYIGKAGQGLKNYISELLKICPGVPDDWENFHLRRILHPQSKSKHISGKRKHASDSNLQEDNLESIVLPIEESQEHQISSSSKRNRKRSSRSPSSSYALKANVSRRGEVSSLGRMTKGFHHASSMSLFDDKDHEQIIDSDEDAPQEWRIELERKDIENLKDATFSEKKLMLMWNEFVQKSAPHADFAFPSYLLKFVKNQKDEILLGNLRLAFLSHLMTLWEFGLIQAHHIEASISILDSSQKS